MIIVLRDYDKLQSAKYSILKLTFLNDRLKFREILLTFKHVSFCFTVNCEADDPPVTDDVVSVYVIVVIVVVSLLLVGAVAFIIMRALLYNSK